MLRTFLVPAAALSAAALALPATAPASLKIAHDSSSERLRVDAAGRAEISWHEDGRRRTAVVTGDRIRYGARIRSHAARQVVTDVPQALVQYRLPDGRTFALQKLRRLGQFGRLGRLELRFARWRGQPTQLTLTGEWIGRGTIPRVCGTATYHGVPFYGYAHTPQGNPLDSLGRNVYLDVLQPSGSWYRIFGVLTRPQGYAVMLRTPEWQGIAYRATVPGPNVDGDLAPDAIATTPMPDRSATDRCPFPVGMYAGM